MDKARRKIFVNLTNNRYAPLQEMSSDTTGSISQQDLTGRKYLQLIADSGTGYLTGVPMKTKGEASDAIQRELTRLQLLCGKKVERFHTDNAEDQSSGSIKAFLDKQGTVRSFTAPTFSPSNAILERRFESIFAAARTALKTALSPVNAQANWSFVALDAIDKANYISFKRDGIP